MLRGERTWLRMIEKADVLATDVDDRDLGHYAGFKFAFAGEMVDGWLNELRGEMMAGTAFQFSICLIGSREPDRRSGAPQHRPGQRQRSRLDLPDRCHPLGRPGSGPMR